MSDNGLKAQDAGLVSTYAVSDTGGGSIDALSLTVNIKNYIEADQANYARVELIPTSVGMDDSSDPIDFNNDISVSDIEVTNGSFTHLFNSIQDGTNKVAYYLLKVARPYFSLRLIYYENQGEYRTQGDNGEDYVIYQPVILTLPSILENATYKSNVLYATYNVSLCKRGKIMTLSGLEDSFPGIKSGFLQYLMDNSSNNLDSLQKGITLADFTNICDDLYNYEPNHWTMACDGNIDQLIVSDAYRYLRMPNISAKITYYDKPSYSYGSSVLNVTGGTVSMSIDKNNYSAYSTEMRGGDTTLSPVLVGSYAMVKATPLSGYTIEGKDTYVSEYVANDTTYEFKAYKNAEPQDTVRLTVSNVGAKGSGDYFILKIYTRTGAQSLTKGTLVSSLSCSLPSAGNSVTKTFNIKSSQNTGYWYGEIDSQYGVILNTQYLNEPSAGETSYTLYLDAVGSSKTLVIKAISTINGSSLSQAKAFVDSVTGTTAVPSAVTTSLSTANGWKSSLTNVGATAHVESRHTGSIYPAMNKTSVLAKVEKYENTSGRSYVIRLFNATMKATSTGGVFVWEVLSVAYNDGETLTDKSLPYNIGLYASIWNDSSFSKEDYGTATYFTLSGGTSYGNLAVEDFVLDRNSNEIKYNYIDGQLFVNTTDASNVVYGKNETSFDVGKDHFRVTYN